MAYEQVWFVIVGGLIVAWGAISALSTSGRSGRRMRVREMLHRERMAAIEKGLPLHDLPADLLVEPGDDPRAAVNIERTALGAGLVLLLGGIGMVIGLLLVPETRETAGMNDLASLGAIPMMVGAGLLLYYVLSRRTRG